MLKSYIIDSGWDSNKVTFIPNFVNPNKKTKLDLKFDIQETEKFFVYSFFYQFYHSNIFGQVHLKKFLYRIFRKFFLISKIYIDDENYYLSNIKFDESENNQKTFYEVGNIQQLNSIISKEFKKINLD